MSTHRLLLRPPKIIGSWKGHPDRKKKHFVEPVSLFPTGEISLCTARGIVETQVQASADAMDSLLTYPGLMYLRIRDRDGFVSRSTHFGTKKNKEAGLT